MRLREQLDAAAKTIGAEITDDTGSMVELYWPNGRKQMIYYIHLLTIADAIEEINEDTDPAPDRGEGRDSPDDGVTTS